MNFDHLTIRDVEGERRFSAADLPLRVGTGIDCQLRLPGPGGGPVMVLVETDVDPFANPPPASQFQAEPAPTLSPDQITPTPVPTLVPTAAPTLAPTEVAEQVEQPEQMPTEVPAEAEEPTQAPPGPTVAVPPSAGQFRWHTGYSATSRMLAT